MYKNTYVCCLSLQTEAQMPARQVGSLDYSEEREPDRLPLICEGYRPGLYRSGNPCHEASRFDIVRCFHGTSLKLCLYHHAWMYANRDAWQELRLHGVALTERCSPA